MKNIWVILKIIEIFYYICLFYDQNKMRELFMAIITSKILEIIARHKEEICYAVYRSQDGISMISGKVADVGNNELVMQVNKDNSLVGLSLITNSKRELLHLYNKLLIDLVNARKTVDLSKKVANRNLQKLILANLKKKLGKDLLFVYKAGEDIHVSRGRFKDMRTKDIVLALGPFYNQDESLFYHSVLHIYSPDGEDLIDV